VDDYAFLIRGLLDLYECCHDDRWLQWAEQLQTKQDELFWDSEGGGYYSTQDGDSSIVLRMKEGGSLANIAIFFFCPTRFLCWKILISLMMDEDEDDYSNVSTTKLDDFLVLQRFHWVHSTPTRNRGWYE
jgi:hypothetical protein